MIEIDEIKKKERTMNELNLSSPWVTYCRKLKALFSEDPAVKVELDEESISVRIYVEGPKKAEAISKLLPVQKTFGNVVLTISVIPSNRLSESKAAIFRDAFEGNPAVIDVVESRDPIMMGVNYVIFKNKVVQYFNDNIGDVNGVTSTLYQDVAREVIGNTSEIFFCTELGDDVIFKCDTAE